MVVTSLWRTFLGMDAAILLADCGPSVEEAQFAEHRNLGKTLVLIRPLGPGRAPR